MTTKIEPRPEVGCGAIILDAEGRILLMQRLKEPEAGGWGLSGGKIDFGERAEIAITREVEEELGIIVEVDRLALISEIIDGGDGRHWVSPVYLMRHISGEPRCMEPEKHGGVGWYTLDALPDYLTSPTKDAIAWLKSQ